ncbi:T9SS type A sorting domain-containing protein [Aquimarina sp. TRL1]|uniref:M14 family zinc carboxypeptidase n=1 Tax=Aquimarina sp. (strain TRL1) TaxID=2736252 RepID=UPI00158EFA4E|nr:M14 family zinc carboxypeptidase [Aquimarina sp. TRL1]QKX03427.1 T9SS type A sorting domain-containing protein [Aquimarina sp. TRL1]
MYTNSTHRLTRIGYLCTLIFLCCTFLINAQEKHYRVQIYADKTQLTSFHDQGFEADHFHFENGAVITEISAKDLQFLKKNKIKHKILIRNLEKRIPRRNKKIDRKNAKQKNKVAAQQVPTPSNFSLGSIAGFHSHDEAVAMLDKMRQLYPNLITAKSSIGTSIEGRSIYMVKISDNPTQDENEDEMLFTSIHHAREPIGLSQTLFYMWYLLENYETNDEIKTLVDNMELYFIPIVNPDGYIHNQNTNPNGGGYWRKNRRRNSGGSYGVDLNRNYGYKWGTQSSSNPRSDTYHGTSGFSEPETKALRDFSNQHNFIAALNYHSYGNLLIHPWGYKANTFTPDQDTFVAMCKYMTEENNYKYGTPNQTVNYSGSGSSDDWMYGEQNSKSKMMAMTPEVGSGNDGFWPASSRIIPLCNQAFPLNIKVMRMVARYAVITPSTASQTITTLSGNIDFSIKRYSLKQANWKVSLASDSPYISSLGQPKEYSNLTLLGTSTGSISYQLKANTPKGTKIPIRVVVSNGSWEYTKEVIITYNGDGGGDTQSPTIPAGLEVTNVTATSVGLSWNPSTDNVGVTGYDVYQGNSLATSVTQTTAVINGLSPNTTYTFKVRAKDAAGNVSGFSTEVRTTTTGGGTTYCEAKSNNATDEYIGRVQLGDIDNTTAAGSGYNDHTALQTNLTKNNSYTITITPKWKGTQYREAYSVWIDYNKDGDFKDQGEQVWTKNASTTSPVSGDFVVPSNATDGATRMRVIMRYSKLPSSCGVFDYGEVEDYTVVITGIVGNDTQAPSIPKSLIANNVTESSLSLSWDASTDNVGVTAYEVFQGNSLVKTETTTTSDITGLTAATAYQFKVRAKDAAGNISDFSTALAVTTQGNSGDPCAGVAPYDSNQTYQVGERVVYFGRLYEKTATSWKFIALCGAASKSHAKEISDLSSLADEIILFPSPTKNKLFVMLPYLDKETPYKILDLKGKVVKKGFVKEYIELEAIASGTYVIQIKTETKTVNKRFIKVD